MSIRTSLALFLTASLAIAAGCASDNEKIIAAGQGQNCSGEGYAAFDEANHAAQDARLAATETMAEDADEAIADLSKAAIEFGEIEELYQSTADFQMEVQGIGDEHFAEDPEAAKDGEAIDADITAAIARGKAATSAIEVKIAKQIIDRSLLHHFALYAFHEVLEGERAPFDEAYGILGTGPANDPAGRRGLAAAAAEMDGINGTTLAADLFDALRAGSCALDQALTASGADKVDWTKDEAYGEAVRALDGTIEAILATAAGHEFAELADQADLEDATEELYEGAYLFRAIERKMRAMGGDAAANAEGIRARLDAAIAASEMGGSDWQAALDAGSIRAQIAAAFGVTIKG